MQIFLTHQFLEKLRSIFRSDHIIANIFVGFLSALLITYLVFIGFFLDVVLLDIYPDADVVRKVTELLFYYLSTDLILRFLFQGSSSISIDHYRLLPIKRAKIIVYTLAKSLFSLLNLDPGSQSWLKWKLQVLNESGTTMIISSHDLKQITEIASRIILLEKGRIVEDCQKNDETLINLESYFKISI